MQYALTSEASLQHAELIHQHETQLCLLRAECEQKITDARAAQLSWQQQCSKSEESLHNVIEQLKRAERDVLEANESVVQLRKERAEDQVNGPIINPYFNVLSQ